MKLTKFFALLCAVVAFAACEKPAPEQQKEPEATGDLTLEADVEIGEMGKPITFTVWQGEEGEEPVDVTALAEIYDKNTYEKVSNPFTPALDGSYSFYAVKGSAVSKPISLTVKEAVPVLPEDANAANLDFAHRALLVDHTGTGCPNCPRVFSAIKLLENTKYHDWFYEAFSHSYNSTDPAYSEDATNIVSKFYNSVGVLSGYPSMGGNFYDKIETGLAPQGISTEIMDFLDDNHKAKADVGIAASAVALSTKVSVVVEVKSAKTQEYRIAYWLLEDGIYGAQSGANAAWQSTHNNAIRKVKNSTDKDLSGESIGTIEEGKTWKSGVVEIGPLGKKWKRENLEVMIIVSAKDSQNRFNVANVAICPVNTTIDYEYNK